MSNSHQNFQFSECGLFLNEKYPQFGASPDGVFTCDYCGSGFLEVKCPYSMRDSHKLELPWLHLINGEMKLQKNPHVLLPDTNVALYNQAPLL